MLSNSITVDTSSQWHHSSNIKLILSELDTVIWRKIWMFLTSTKNFNMADPGVLEDWLQKCVREPTLKYESLQLKSENHLRSPHRKRSAMWTYWIFKIAALSSIMLFANHLVCQSLFLLILQRFQRVYWKIKLYKKLRKAD